MPNFHELYNELQQAGFHFDILRNKYILNLYNIRQRNIICYYSGWLDKPIKHWFVINRAVYVFLGSIFIIKLVRKIDTKFILLIYYGVLQLAVADVIVTLPKSCAKVSLIVVVAPLPECSVATTSIDKR